MPFPGSDPTMVPAVGAETRPLAINGSWIPPVDVAERNGALHLTIDLPGVAEDSIVVEADERRVRVVGSRPRTSDRPTEVISLERPAGPFERCFRFRNPIDLDRVSAKYDRGVLSIVLPRKAETEVRIPVSSA